MSFSIWRVLCALLPKNLASIVPLTHRHTFGQTKQRREAGFLLIWVDLVLDSRVPISIFVPPLKPQHNGRKHVWKGLHSHHVCVFTAMRQSTSPLTHGLRTAGASPTESRSDAQLEMFLLS